MIPELASTWQLAGVWYACLILLGQPGSPTARPKAQIPSILTLDNY
jgi:hypothetical protein